MRFFDNALTPWFALLTSVWGLLFTLFWQRKLNYYRYKWNMESHATLSPYSEEVRHQFKPKGYRPNVITGEIDVYFPATNRFLRQLVSFSVVFFFWILAIGSIIAQAYFQTWIASLQLNPEAASIATATFGLGCIWTLRFIYSPLCQLLSEWENYKKEQYFEEAALFKRLSLEIINVFGRLFYL